MSRVKLTDAVVSRASLPHGKIDVVLWDSELTGFGLRLRPVGKTYVIAYRAAGSGRSGQFKKMRIGTPESIGTATEARARARVILGSIATGTDPLAEKAKARSNVKTTIADMLTGYDADLLRRRYVRRVDTMSLLNRRMHKLRDRDVREVTGLDLTHIMDELTEAGTSGSAQGFRSRVSAFFAWCVTKRVINVNPLAGYRKQRSTRADRVDQAEHGRALNDDELRRLWLATDTTTTFGRLVRFYILTACRRGEGKGLTYRMVGTEVRGL